ncbi:MAG: helix-turn-helix domain-containing protein [Desulfurococcales archaeon]|nr:helix-turn-helix domain-containing protein [Desulfurococcales archaeon]
MPSKPVRAIILMKNKCPLAEILASNGLSDIIVKPISVYHKNNRISMWARVKGRRKNIKRALRLLSKIGGVSFTVINESQDSMLLHLHFSSKHCPHRDMCPLVNPIGDLLVTSSMFSGSNIIMLVVSPSLRNLKMLEKQGFDVLDIIDSNEPGMLTEDQEAILLYAYERGYYNYPRGITLKDISNSLGLSLSTVAEILRRAEKKIIDYVILYDALLCRYRINGGDGSEEKWERMNSRSS